jgi:glycosyl transferase family 1
VKILYLTEALPDYLSDDLLYGLRGVLGADLVDVPRKDVLYRDSPLSATPEKVYGRGFHCFGLDDLPVDRSDIAAKIRTGYFDLIVNSSAWRIRSPLHPRLVVVDGEDHARLAPRYAGRVAAYFKRELAAAAPGILPIQFALPDFLRDDASPPRVRRYHASFRPTSDIRRRLAEVLTPRYSFATWREYVTDIKESWFAVSPRGAGYDCQRHYEILGNAVLCIFLDGGAPAALRESFVDGENCLAFTGVDDLVRKVEACSDPGRLIERGRRDLVDRHLATRRAEQVLAAASRYADTGRRPGRIDGLAWRLWLGRRAA